MAKNLCVKCRVDSGNNRICDACYRAAFAPCTRCGKPKATINTLGKPTRVTTCRACTSHLNADTHRCGKTCLVCAARFQTRLEAHTKSVCDSCLAVQVPCPQCGTAMPKYKAKGGERSYCSHRCVAKSVPFSVRSSAGKKANQTKWRGHVYKSLENDIARGKAAYVEWRKAVFARDNYTCQRCGLRSGNGHAVVLHPHHLQSFAEHPDLRYDLGNGITLCQSCHRLAHDHVFIGRVSARTSDKARTA